MSTEKEPGKESGKEKTILIIVGLIAAIIYAKYIIILIQIAFVIGFVVLVYYILEWLGIMDAIRDWLDDDDSETTQVQQKTPFLTEVDVDYRVRNAIEKSKADNLRSLQKIADLEASIAALKKDNEQNEERIIEKLKKENKSSILNDIFGSAENKLPTDSDYSGSTDYEKQQFQYSTRKREEELRFREFSQTANEKFFYQDIKIQENKQEIHSLRQDMDSKILLIQTALLDLKNQVITLTVYFDRKFNEVEIAFHTELASIKESLVTFKADVSQNFTDVRLQFGQEILRLDQAQLKIIERIGVIQEAVKVCGLEMNQLRNLFDQGQIRAEEMISRATILHEKSQLSMQAISKDVQLSLQQMSLHKQSFANEVGGATLKLERISQDQYLALKDIAYEKMGVDMLRKECDQRAALEQGKLNNMFFEKQRLEERIQERISRNEQVMDLKHQLHMAEERIGYASQRMNLMQQEASIIRRYSKLY